MRIEIPVLVLLAITSIAVASDGMPETGDAVNIEFGIRNAAGVPTREFRQGETVRFVFHVHNAGAEALQLAYTFPPHGVAVSKGGNSVWQAWSGRMFAQVIRTQDLPPGETAEFFIDWNLASNDGEPIPAGSYEAKAAFNAFLQPGNRRLTPDLPPLTITVEQGVLE